MTLDFRLLHLADSAFPIGGFAHSGGLEAAVQLGWVDGRRGSLPRFIHGSLWQAGYAMIPYVGEAHRHPEALERIDRHHHTTLLNAVASRASRTQGGAFLETCARIFPHATRLQGHGVAPYGHFAPLFGATLRGLGVSCEDAQSLALYCTLRSSASAALRLGIATVTEAHRLQEHARPWLDQVLAECSGLGLHDVAQTAPAIDALGAMADQLYSRLFQS